MFTACGKRTSVAAPHQSKIGDFCQLPPSGEAYPERPWAEKLSQRQWTGKNLPPGGRWLAAGETDEEQRNLPKRMHPNKTHPRSISTPLGSSYGRIWRFLRRAGACPSPIRCGSHSTYQAPPHQSLPPSGEGGPAKAGSDEGPGQCVYCQRQKNQRCSPSSVKNQRFLPASPEGEA